MRRPILHAPSPGLSLALLIALWVGLIAVAAGGLLWALSAMPHGEAHMAAAQRVVRQGMELTRFLGRMQMLRSTNTAALAWQRLPFLVDGLHSAQSGLQYVEISHDGVTLFHRQTGSPAGAPPAPPLPPLATLAPPTSFPVRVSRQWVERYGERIPVVVFRQDLPHPDGSTVSVEVGLRREAVSEQEHATNRAVRLMFRLSILTILAAFGTCLAALVWAARRDRRRELRRRREEHLAFSGMLANGIVHDFRNPMSSVRLDAQMLARETQRAEGARPERLAELAERIGRTLDRMDTVFKEFLFLSRPATESTAEIELARCAAECVETLAPRLEQGGVRVAVDAPPEPARVRASPAALRRALLNVLLNAVQHSPAGGAIDIVIRAAGGEWVIDLCDRGPGIPAPARESVFEMFTTGRPGGTGLGLFLARTAVTNCGGRIEARPREGGGTIIRITLPASNPDP